MVCGWGSDPADGGVVVCGGTICDRGDPVDGAWLCRQGCGLWVGAWSCGRDLTGCQRTPQTPQLRRPHRTLGPRPRCQRASGSGQAPPVPFQGPTSRPHSAHTTPPRPSGSSTEGSAPGPRPSVVSRPDSRSPHTGAPGPTGQWPRSQRFSLCPVGSRSEIPGCNLSC